MQQQGDDEQARTGLPRKEEALTRRSGWFGRWFGPRTGRCADETADHLLVSLLNMAWFVEARDPYTGGHLWRVSRYARLLAEAVGLDAAEVARVSLGGFLHDLGKIGVPDAILCKSAPLTDAEWAVMRTHPDIGMRLLAAHPLAFLVRDAIGLHHERPDGCGYPRGLTLEAIPVAARIVGICDAFDAMTSSRPYRRGMPRDEALAILCEQAGHQFESGLAERFVQLGRSKQLDHILGHSDDGMPLQVCPNCGPTLVVRRTAQPTERIYCRNCGGEFRLLQKDNSLHVEPTGRRGSAVDLQPEADLALLQRILAEARLCLRLALPAAAAGPGAAR